MDNLLFRIRNLKVAFNNNCVLHVPSLDIPRGKMIFVLGNSGCGKTTLLETLGLMSKYYNEKAQILFYPKSQSKPITYEQIWQDDNLLSAIRRNYFSFMFQDTNLFPQFSVPENIALTQVIHNVKKSDAIDHAVKELINLEIINLVNNTINKMSGGERQRVAFARSLLSKGNVFFADEPTGNLGENDAHQIMTDIQNYIHKSSGFNTAIIVTHNIDVALEYADVIIVIQNNHYIGSKSYIEQKQPRQISKEEINSILNSEENETIDPEIIEVKNSEIENTELVQYSEKNFKELFSKKSTEDLSLKKKRNWLLVGVLLIALWAIGYSDGALVVLEEKISNPFINWISLEVPRSSEEKIPELLKTFSDPVIKTRFSIKDVSGYYRFLLTIKNKNSNGPVIAIGNTISLSDTLLYELEKNQNLKAGTLFKGDHDIGLILSKRFIESFDYSQTDDFVFMSMVVDKEDVWVPVPIRGIVENLPNKVDFISTPYFYQKRYRDNTIPFSPEHTEEIILFCKGDKENAKTIMKSLENYVNSIDSLKNGYDPYVFIDNPSVCYKPWGGGEIIKVSFLKKVPIQTINAIAKSFIDKENANNKIIEIYKYPDTSAQEYDGFNRVSINVKNLNFVDDISKVLEKDYGLEIDMETRESLNNYHFIAQLSLALSFIIIAISLSSVCIFIVYILYLHLYKNRKYIGLLKAFGVMPNTLKSIYINKLLLSLAIATGVSMVLASLIGYSCSFNFFESIIYPFNKIFLLFIVLVFSISYISLYITAGSILKNSPGDLIYDRINHWGKKRKYSLKTTVTPTDGGSVTAYPAATDNMYEEGNIVILTTKPSVDCVFKSWTGGVADAPKAMTWITINRDKTVMAAFDKVRPK